MKETKKGIVFALAACLCWTIGDILVKQIQGVTSNVHPILLTEIALLGGLLTYFFVIFLIKKQDQVFQMAWGDKKRYALHGLLSLAIAYLAFFASIGMIGLMPAVIITTAWPIASMVVGFFYLKEEFTFLKLVGGGMVTASIYLVI